MAEAPNENRSLRASSSFARACSAVTAQQVCWGLARSMDSKKFPGGPGTQYSQTYFYGAGTYKGPYTGNGGAILTNDDLTTLNNVVLTGNFAAGGGDNDVTGNGDIGTEPVARRSIVGYDFLCLDPDTVALLERIQGAAILVVARL